jgi:hypothetical protein
VDRDIADCGVRIADGTADCDIADCGVRIADGIVDPDIADCGVRIADGTADCRIAAAAAKASVQIATRFEILMIADYALFNRISVAVSDRSGRLILRLQSSS